LKFQVILMSLLQNFLKSWKFVKIEYTLKYLIYDVSNRIKRLCWWKYLKKAKMWGGLSKNVVNDCWFCIFRYDSKLMHQLDLEFESKRGRPAYPRTLLLIVVLYCFSIDISNYAKMEEECKKNKFLLIATCGLKPSRNSFANFLNKSDANVSVKNSTDWFFYLVIFNHIFLHPS